MKVYQKIYQNINQNINQNIKQRKEKHMNAEILSVGTELLLGDIVNTNTQYIAKGLAELGINVYRQSVVGDNRNRLKKSMEESLQRADLLIITGGLGPTTDDLTREVAAEVLGKKLILDQSILDGIQGFFDQIKVPMEKSNNKQAYLPEGAFPIENPNGTSPGILIETGEKIVMMLPGPPRELQPMFDNHIKPYLNKYAQGIVKSKVLHVFGIGESTMEAMIEDLIEGQDNPSIAPYCMEQGLILRITARAREENTADEMIRSLEEKVQKRLGEYIYGVDHESLEGAVVKALKNKGYTLSVAESCTGGLVAASITNVPGASEVFPLALVTYSDDSKTNLLGVPKDIIKSRGAVSKETACAMAKGIQKIGGTTMGLSITGIAGPGGGTANTPLGLVHIALAFDDKVVHEEKNLLGDRNRIRQSAAKHALNLVRKVVREQ